jgi:UDP:flavonoid glycosyltransferase YjiC (YdhE family)
MARFLFLSWDGAGNQPPAIAIAQALKERSHDVTFAGYENQREYFTTRGWRFVLMESSAATWRDEPPERMFDVKVRSAWASLEHLDDVPRLISRERCDVLIIDCLMFGALAAAEKARVSAVALVHSAPGALVPPMGRLEAHLHDRVNEVRIQAGLPAIANLWDAWDRFPALCNSIRELDPLASQAPKSLIYVGPFSEQAPPSGWKSPWHPKDTRPLVLVSFSTSSYWDQSSRIERTLKALAHQDCRVLVTAGSSDISPAALPANAKIIARIPHDEILPDVAVTVTHAGHGTVTASLRHGVPLLCLPNFAADQPILASQVEALGAGRALDGDNATPAEILAAMHELLTDPSYIANARMLAGAISAAPGMSVAVEQLERSANTARVD